jgi:hypothetical protein
MLASSPLALAWILPPTAISKVCRAHPFICWHLRITSLCCITSYVLKQNVFTILPLLSSVLRVISASFTLPEHKCRNWICVWECACVILGIEPRVLRMPGKHSMAELHLWSQKMIFLEMQISLYNFFLNYQELDNIHEIKSNHLLVYF